MNSAETHSSLPPATLSESMQTGAPTRERENLRQTIPAVFLKKSRQSIHQLANKILEFGLAQPAIKIIEDHPALSKAITHRWKEATNPNRNRLIRYHYARMIAQEGFVARGHRLIHDLTPESSLEWMIQGWFKMAFGNVENAVKEFGKACQLAPDDLIARGSHLHALAHAGDALNAAEKLKTFREAKKHPELDAWLGNRIAETLRLAGQVEESEKLLTALLEESQVRISDRTFTLTIMGSVKAALGKTTDSRHHFDLAMQHSKKQGKGYANRIWILNRMVECGQAGPSEKQLLRALSNRLIGQHTPAAALEGCDQSTQSTEDHCLMIDVGRNEYRLNGMETLCFGCPLELKLIAWCAVISPCFPVPRALLIELLWPNSDANIRALQSRLSQLLHRAENVYPIELRDRATEQIRIRPEHRQKIIAKFSPNEIKPSYFDGKKTPFPKEFASYYGISERAAQNHFRNYRWKETLASTVIENQDQ